MRYKDFFEQNVPDLEKGDIIKVGKWKNKPVEIVDFGKDDKNQPTIDTKPVSGTGKGKERKMFPFKIGDEVKKEVEAQETTEEEES